MNYTTPPFYHKVNLTHIVFKNVNKDPFLIVVKNDPVDKEITDTSQAQEILKKFML